MSRKYGIKFSGPVRKNVWWKKDGAYGREVMTFKDINEAYRWSQNSIDMFPHCQYIVSEIPNEAQETQTTKTSQSLHNASKKTKSRPPQKQA